MRTLMTWRHWPRPTTNIREIMSNTYLSTQWQKTWVSEIYIFYWFHPSFSHHTGARPAGGNVSILWHGNLWRDWEGWNGDIEKFPLHFVSPEMVQNAFLAPHWGWKVSQKQNFGVKWIRDPTMRGAPRSITYFNGCPSWWGPLNILPQTSIFGHYLTPKSVKILPRPLQTKSIWLRQKHT